MLPLLLACQGGSPDPADSGPRDSAPPQPVDTAPPLEPLSAAITVSTAFDPVHDGRAQIDVVFTEGAQARVWVSDETGAVVATLVEGLAVSDDFSWGGRDDANALLPAGTYTLTVEATREDEVTTASAAVRSVRLGAIEGTIGGDRLPLIWHRASSQGSYWPAPIDGVTFALSALEEGGQVVDVPEPWAELAVAPIAETVGVNWPAALAHDAVPTLSLTLDGELLDVDGALSVSAAGWSLSSGTVAPGETVVLVRDAALGAGPVVVEESVVLTFALGEDEIGEQAIPLRMYGLLGAHTFEETGPQYGAWVAAIDPALRAIEGVEPEPEAVIAALVAFIFEDLGLRYDTAYGASAYVSYQGGSWSRAHFSFASFLSRANGDVINCTDAAAILGGYANMLGADLSYLILDPNFALNYILAIGGDAFTNCPFGPGGCGFSYHAVTSPDGGETIFDATLALDGDGDPGSLPGTEWLVQGVEAADYTAALVRGGTPSYHSLSKGTIQ